MALIEKETPAALQQVLAVRRHCGIWARDDHTFIRITGPDAASWLQTQTTNDVLQLASGAGHASALLDRQGRIQAHFTLHRWHDEYWLIVERAQVKHLLEHLDAHLFIERVAVEETGDSLDQFVIQGPRALGVLAATLDTRESIASELLPREPFGCHPIETLGHETLAFRLSLTGEDGYVLILEKGQGEDLIARLLAAGHPFGLQRVQPEAREILRVEAGIPRFGIDFDITNPIPETTLERAAVSYDKGCYLGQEVVARLRTYGSVKHALMGLIVNAPLESLPPRDTPLLIDGKKVGILKSAVSSPTLHSTIAMAYLDRDHRAPGSVQNFTAAEQPFSARIVALPFYEAPSHALHAHALYDEALSRFEKDAEDIDPSAIPLLKESILLDPAFEDAYEALGVILHRQQRVDEAIHYMKRLAALNPNCLMAHTNLSVFYVAKGMIEEAEQEKALAAVLGIQRASDERKAKELADAERTRLEREALERIQMFREVLDIDPDDSVATFGLGKAYMQLNRYADAIPYFQRAAETQKDYSAAYLNLGKCHEFLNAPDLAAAAYKKGIAAAGRKGDLMPLREMERRLNALLDNAPQPL